MRNRKAQFYLIAAIILIGMIILLASVTNYIVIKDKPVKFYDLGEEFKEEGARVVDYSIYREQEVPAKILDLTKNYLTYYSEEKERGSELVFVYGNKNAIRMTRYTFADTGAVSLVVDGTPYEVTGTGKYNDVTSGPIVPNGDTVEVKILEQTYNFNLHEGENFFFVIAKKDDEETYITEKK